MFYAGGANSIRAFSVRGVGPGAFPYLGDTSYGYIFQNGNAKFVTNLEYRRQLFGSLHGAVFLDAGNVWYTDATFGYDESFDKAFERGRLRLSSFFNDLALGTGVGIRYDLGFLVLRLDWGLAFTGNALYSFDPGLKEKTFIQKQPRILRYSCAVSPVPAIKTDKGVP